MNKNLISQLVVSICAILLIATVTFAWFAISNTADAGFVAQVGDLESDFEFAAIEEGSLVAPEGNQLLNMKDVIPGQKFYFVMMIKTKGETDGYVSIMLNDIKSYYATPTGNDDEYKLEDEYSHECEKIQYAFSYSITGAYWVPYGDDLEKELDQSEHTSIIKPSWEEFTNEEQVKYYPKYDGTNEDEQHVRFNKEDSENSSKNKDDYILLKNVLIKGASTTDEDKTASDHNAFVVLFEIDYLGTAVVPDFVSTNCDLPGGCNFNSKDSNVYEKQLFSISHITIITSKENE